jgi:membrane-associated protein
MAAFLGNLCGYWFGRSTGPLLFKRKDSWFFHQNHLAVAKRFFDSYGGLALTVGFFLPIIRTFTPIISGVIKYQFARFTMFSLLGAVLWANTLVLSGYLLGNIPFVKKNLEFIIVAMILIITLPVIFKLFREFGKLKPK